MTDPGPMRRSYSRSHLDRRDLAEDWLAQFRRWFDDAVATPAVVEANALQLATVDADGSPAVRTVLAKSVDERGVVFYTNHDSAKGRALAANPRAALVFSWLPLERQVRLSGPVEQVSRAETDAYFATRPRGSQLGAWASPQSDPVDSRTDLDERLARVEARFGDGPIPAPPNWGGYLLGPRRVEFWQGRPNRLHDRLVFALDSGTGDPAWTVTRLAP